MRSLPSPALSKHRHRKCKHSFWSLDIRRFNPIKCCLWDQKHSKRTGSQNDVLSSFATSKKKTHQCHLQILNQICSLRNWKLHLSPVIHCSPPVNFLATKPKNYLFSVQSVEESKETVCLIRQPAQATRGVDRLSSAVWEEAELQDQSPTHRGQASGCR